MKKKIGIYSLVAILVILTFYLCITAVPFPFNKTFDAYMMRESEESGQLVTLRFEGEYRNSIIFGNMFVGNIYINNEVITNVYQNGIQSSLKLKFDRDLFVRIYRMLPNEKTGEYDINKFGDIAINSKFSKVLITIDEEDTNTSGFKKADDLFIVAPAYTRDEALSIFDTLRRKLY